MKRFCRIVIIISLLSIKFSSTTVLATQCDQPAAQETVRIYFANGMSNNERMADYGRAKLQEILGMTNRDFGKSYNDNVNWLEQLLQVYNQRQNSSDDFWYWLRNMGDAPQWFHDEYVQKVGRFNENMVRNEPDLERRP